VLDKACRFMRAHLAQIVVDFSPLSRELCMQLVEETLELDEWIHSVAAIHTDSDKSGADSMRIDLNATNSAVPRFTPLTVCEVLFDAKEVFHQWLHLEHRFFHFEVRSKCRDAKRVFGFEFGDTGFSGGASAKEGVATTTVGEPLRMTKVRCYSGVYDCMCLFFSACERYKHLPASAQRVFSVCILEPLLCTALGLLLYRTRNSSTLYQISMGTYRTEGSSKSLSRTAPSTPTTVLEVPRELVEFIDSAFYLQSCLAASAQRTLCSRSAAEFKSSLWSELQSWMPQILISEEDARKGFSTVDLVDKAWKLPVEYGLEQDYGYRNPPSANASGKGRSAKLPTAGGSQKTTAVSEIGECVDVARGLAITLCNVLKQQLSVCK
jgi:hypothetical protein